MPDGSHDSYLKLAITLSRRDKLVMLLSQLLAKRPFPNSELNSLIGKLAFAQTSVMSKLARAQLRPMYAAARAFPKTVPL